MKSGIIKLSLPVPCSVNKAYVNVGLKVKTRAKSLQAKEWKKLALHAALPQIRQYRDVCDRNMLNRVKYKKTPAQLNVQAIKAAHPGLRYQVKYQFFFVDDIARDIFNFEKLLTDLLVDCGFLLDDNFIELGIVERMPSDALNPRVEIEIIYIDSACQKSIKAIQDGGESLLTQTR